jgi:FAD/FMN-containing dehydrogenase
MVTKKEIFAYQTDASRLVGEAAKVVFPTNLDELQNAVRNAETNIVPRGAGTNLVGGCIPNNSVIIDLSKLNRLKDFTPGSIYAEAGVTLKELNEKLETLGFEFPINPMNNGISTIGGMIATNASGSRAMKYGQMKDWIDSIDFVTGRGEILKTSKADIMDLCGMEGITGIILGAKLRLIPKVKRTASLFQSENLDDILSLARRLKQEKEVCAADLLGKEISKILGFPEKYNLIIEFDSERGKIQGEDYQKIIEKRDKIFFTMMKNEYVTNEDPKLFFDKLKEFITFLEVNQIPYFSISASELFIHFSKIANKEREMQ